MDQKISIQNSIRYQELKEEMSDLTVSAQNIEEEIEIQREFEIILFQELQKLENQISVCNIHSRHEIQIGSMSLISGMIEVSIFLYIDKLEPIVLLLTISLFSLPFFIKLIKKTVKNYNERKLTLQVLHKKYFAIQNYLQTKLKPKLNDLNEIMRKIDFQYHIDFIDFKRLNNINSNSVMDNIIQQKMVEYALDLSSIQEEIDFYSQPLEEQMRIYAASCPSLKQYTLKKS